jgi:TolB-like protein/DNA-binding winged helix-turn-helix (wHTH) protein/Tfp pilus assembly protein PilF
VASDSVNLQETLRFGDDFELDVQAYELRCAGRVLKLEHIPMTLLLLLLEQRGQIVTRDQIVERIWGKNASLDTDNSINGAIRKIRQVLKDDPERPRFVQTISRRGYRFLAPVTESGSIKAVVIPEPSALSQPAGEHMASPPALPAAAWRWVLLVLAIVVLAASGAYFLRVRTRTAVPQGNGRVMLAVLPFENLTGDAGQDYLSDGLTEEMITQLGNADSQHLGVIARTSVMHYKHTNEPLDRIGSELGGVQYVLEGSVRRDADQVRVTAQLIQMRDQSHVWARQYDRKLSSLLTLQSEIAREIADEIQLTLGNQKHVEATTLSTFDSPRNYEAYDLYLKGRYFWNKRTEEGFRQATECFRQAVNIDPTYARAYAGLADSYALTSAYGLVPSMDLMPKARAAAVRALEINEGLAEAHTSLAVIAQNFDWDWPTAEREYRRAIQLNPNYATAHHWYAESLALQGRFDEAFPEMERARQLDPLSLIIATDHGAILYFSRQYEPAIKQLRTVLDMEPNFPRANLVIYAYVQTGSFAEAEAQIQKSLRSGTSPWTGALRAYIHGRKGELAKAQSEAHALREQYQRKRFDPLILTVSYIGIGDKDRALEWLERGYREHSPGLTALKVDPTYDPLRSEPRFQELLRRINLSQ